VRPRPESSRLLVFAAFFACGAAGADGLVSAGYREAVFSVADAERYRAFLETVAGWEVRHRGSVDERLLEAWALPADAKAAEIVLANPGTDRGFVRLVQFAGVDAVQIRSSAQSWDTGGFFDVNSRVLDMAAKFAEFQAADWQAVSDPVEFAFGPFVVKEWLVRGPDGIVFALIERVSPPLEGWPALKSMSRLFNATQVVEDFAAAKRFYVETLGFSVYLDHEGASKAPGPNVLGLPHNVATEVTRKVTIVHPQGTNEGSVEILAFDGATGRDFSSRAAPPNLGILTLRFPVADIDAFHEHALDSGLEIAMPPLTVELAPYGRLELMAVRGPGGVWLEFFEERTTLH